MWRRFLVVVLGLLVVTMAPGCADDPQPTLGPAAVSIDPQTDGPDTVAAGPPSVAAALCAGAPAVEGGTVADATLGELSGLAIAGPIPDTVWAIEDSGNAAELALLGFDGTTVARLAVQVANVDWEDLAALPPRGGDGAQATATTLVIADTGDNGRVRADGALHEVEVVFDAAGVPSIGAVSTTTLSYPEQPYDVEALFVDPVDGSRYLISKALDQRTFDFETDTVVFLLPAGDTGPVIAEEVARLQLGTARVVTAADIAADGSVVVVRTYDTVLVWDRLPGATIADTLLREPCEAPAPREAFGEAIALFADGSGFVTVAEATNPPLWQVAGG